MTKPVLIADTEVYKDYFLLAFKNITTGNVTNFEMFEGQALDIDKIRKILLANTIITFNGWNFDIPIIFYALKGATCAELKECCDFIITKGMKSWHCESKFGFKISQKIDHIDLIEVAVGKGSLKAYGGKMHSKKIQDLPLDPSSSITSEFRPFMREYCGNDLQTTLDLYNQVKPQLALRGEMGKKYKIDLRSKSDAQMAEAVIKHELEELTKRKIERPTQTPKDFYYKAPPFLSFKSENLNKLLSQVQKALFVITDGGKVLMPPELDKKDIKIGNSTYRMGIGGLHSCEEKVSYKAENGWVLSDRDANSFYPTIISLCDLYPEHLGKQFLFLYKDLIKERLLAKEKIGKMKKRKEEILKRIRDLENANTEEAVS